MWSRRVAAMQSLAVLLVASLVVLTLVHLGFGRVEAWRDAAASDFEAHLEQFFFAGFILICAGFVAGMAIQLRLPRGDFDWWRTLAFGIVPLLLAMTTPFFIWDWPVLGSSGPLWTLRIDFFSESYFGAMWLLVGLAVASGFARSRRS